LTVINKYLCSELLVHFNVEPFYCVVLFFFLNIWIYCSSMWG